MPTFSKESMKQLITCDSKIQMIFSEVIKEYDCTVLCGFRNEKDQNEAVRKGLSTKPWPTGEHNVQPSRAIDAAPYPINWNDIKRFYHFAGYVQAVARSMGFTLRWGGDWDNDKDLNDQNFFDLPHFELED